MVFVREMSLRENASRIRCKAGIFVAQRGTVAQSTKGWL